MQMDLLVWLSPIWARIQLMCRRPLLLPIFAALLITGAGATNAQIILNGSFVTDIVEPNDVECAVRGSPAGAVMSLGADRTRREAAAQ